MKTTARAQGFTLVELLVVIAIIAILAAIVVLIINPVELTRRGRDATRLTDLANLQQAINVAVQEATDSAQEVLCKGVGAATCVGKSTDTGSREPDGTGWVKVDLTSQSAVSVPTLPVDPSNGSTYHYLYCADTTNGAAEWEINAVLESDQHLTQKKTMENDGGDDPASYEVGSDLGLVGIVANCAY